MSGAQAPLRALPGPSSLPKGSAVRTQRSRRLPSRQTAGQRGVGQPEAEPTQEQQRQGRRRVLIQGLPQEGLCVLGGVHLWVRGPQNREAAGSKVFID